jgi:chromosome segregation ATPase
MRIAKVCIKNYRSFDGQGITLEIPQLSVPLSIIGPNNSGKANFIRALLYGLGVRSVNLRAQTP